MVQDLWGKDGLTGYSVSKFVGTASGEDSPYSVQALLEFKDVESFQKAGTGSDAPKIMGDIKNFR